SFVAQPVQTCVSRTETSSGEAVAATKLNCPNGQTNLQNVACLKIESITSAPAKYVMISQAVHHGEAHRSSHSYTNNIPTNSPMDSHLLRKRRGQFRTGRTNLRAMLRTNMNGQARQKKFPAKRRTSTSAPRKCTHVKVVARFFGASCGPNNPCTIMAALIMKTGIWSRVRAWRCLSRLPARGTRNRSNLLLRLMKL